MPKRPKTRETLEQILASCSDTLFPAELGEAPVEVNSRDVEGDTPLHVMLQRGNDHGVKLLIEAGADVNAVGDMSETPLHLALKQENLAAVEALLAAGAKTTPMSEFDESPSDIARALGGEFQRLVART